MPKINKAEVMTLGEVLTLRDLSKKIYTDEEIRRFKMNEALDDHPLVKRPTFVRSKLAYKELLKNLKPTTKYLIPGQMVLFNYAQPKYKEELEYYDASPLTMFCGITRTNDGNIREIGFNLNYYPPFTRARLIERVYNHFKPYFDKNFNEVTGKPNTWISYDAIKHLMKTNDKIAFGIKMYIPVLRGNSYVIPTRLIPTACFTEGHFSKATLQQVYHFWRKF